MAWRRLKDMTMEEVSGMRSARASGVSMCELSRRYGVSRHTVRRGCAGISKGPRGSFLAVSDMSKGRGVSASSLDMYLRLLPSYKFDVEAACKALKLSREAVCLSVRRYFSSNAFSGELRRHYEMSVSCHLSQLEVEVARIKDVDEMLRGGDLEGLVLRVMGPRGSE